MPSSSCAMPITAAPYSFNSGNTAPDEPSRAHRIEQGLALVDLQACFQRQDVRAVNAQRLST
jgi:hypothetical protein